MFGVEFAEEMDHSVRAALGYLAERVCDGVFSGRQVALDALDLNAAVVCEVRRFCPSIVHILHFVAHGAAVGLTERFSGLQDQQEARGDEAYNKQHGAEESAEHRSRAVGTVVVTRLNGWHVFLLNGWQLAIGNWQLATSTAQRLNGYGTSTAFATEGTENGNGDSYVTVTATAEATARTQRSANGYGKRQRPSGLTALWACRLRWLVGILTGNAKTGND